MAPPEPAKRPLPASAAGSDAPPTSEKRRALPTCLQPRAAPPLQQHRQPQTPARAQPGRQPQQQPRQQQPPQQLPFARFQGALIYVSGDTQAQGFDYEGLLLSLLARADTALQASGGQLGPGLGAKPTVAIDLEWNVSFGGTEKLGPQSTALLQLAVLDDPTTPTTTTSDNNNSIKGSSSSSSSIVVFLFHLAHLTALPPTLHCLLCHRGVRKVGVNVREDMRKLGRDRAGDWGDGGGDDGGQGAGGDGGWPTAFVELSDLANHVAFTTTTNNTNNTKAPSPLAPSRWSLDRLCQAFLGQQVAKPQVLRVSGDWVRRPLSHEQMGYAATDAYATLRCWLAIAARLPPSQPLPIQEMEYMPPSALPPPSPPPAPATAGTGTTATPMPPPPPPPAPPSSSLPPLAPAKRDAHAQFTYHGRSLEEIAAARGGIRVGTVGSYVAEAVAAGYPYDWQRVRAAIAVAGGAVATATAVEEPVWMGKVRTVHAELSLPPPPQQPPKQEEENGGSTTPAASSSAPAASGGASGAAGALRVGTGKVWGALKAEYANGPPALPEYWQVTLFVAHMDREAAAAAVAGDGEGKEAAAAEAEG